MSLNTCDFVKDSKAPLDCFYVLLYVIIPANAYSKNLLRPYHFKSVPRRTHSVHLTIRLSVSLLRSNRLTLDFMIQNQGLT